MKNRLFVLTLLIAFSVSACGPKPNYPTEVNFEIKDITAFSLHTDLQERYAQCADPDDFFVTNYSAENRFGMKNLSAPNPIRVEYTVSDNGDVEGKYVVVSSESENFTSSYEHPATKEGAELYNLKFNTKYYYKIKANFGSSSFESEVKSFTTEDSAIRNIYVEGVENVRDLGGYATEDGKTVKAGMLYRTAQFNYDHENKQAIVSEPTEFGKDVLVNQLGIKTEIDVREKKTSSGKDETVGITSSPLGSTVSYVNLPMRFGGSNVIENTNNKESFKSFIEYCAIESSYPIAFHCVRGTDRTGAMAYAIGALCGMSELDLMKDYLFSNFANINSNYLESTNIDKPGFYVQGIRNEEGNTMSERAANYLKRVLGVSDETLNSIKNILVG